jgi:3-oxoacyl-[acyl-carrier protein] reductase
MGRLDQRVVIVTGGGYGIGRAYCLGLAREGARVVVADIDEKAALRVADEIMGQGGQAIATHTDVADEESVALMARQTLDRFGSIDVLINNAAVYIHPVPLTYLPFDQLPVAEWERVMAVNLKGVFLCCRAVAPVMKNNRMGKIINISSGTVQNGTVGMSPYVTSKAGVIGLTRVLAREFGEFGVTVNAVAPGLTLSDDDPAASDHKRHELRAQARCLKRIETPEDLVGTIIFLSSPDSDFITGQTIAVNGGASFL